MVVTVVAVGVMQVTVHQIVDVVAVGDCLVAAAWTVNVTWLVPSAAVLGRAYGGIGCADSDGVLVHMVAMGVVQVAIVQIINVAVVLHSRVAAARTVLMIVIGVVVGGAIAHSANSFC